MIIQVSDDLSHDSVNLRFGIYLEKNITDSFRKINVFNVSLNEKNQNEKNQDFRLIEN